jgi:hypothetical protein
MLAPTKRIAKYKPELAQVKTRPNQGGTLTMLLILQYY